MLKSIKSHSLQKKVNFLLKKKRNAYLRYRCDKTKNRIKANYWMVFLMGIEYDLYDGCIKENMSLEKNMNKYIQVNNINKQQYVGHLTMFEARKTI